ncbi:hypothetical protein [Methylobacterium sp. J-077]|uniref:hypothetical protein n=1 Tax=Methylobacterium sp. J-077 TaxID=2836656 RepID=UPI001FBAA568|nr:hypothetical protein [Methylobacterium sp. J-077]MCJ2123175.1 hypothetical protein [Methylobacterium sp. J-077]
MTVIRLVAAGLAVVFSLSAARAADGDLTDSIDRPTAAEPVQDAAASAADARPAAVTLPEQRVTMPAPVQKPLPPLKPLPKWDPHVCIGC